jgi:hypothetical protein
MLKIEIDPLRIASNSLAVEEDVWGRGERWILQS